MKIFFIKTLPAISQLLARLGILCLLLFSPLANSQGDVLVVTGNGKIYQKFHSILESKLNKTVAKISSSQVSDEILNKYSLVLSLGTRAASIVSKHETNATLIYSLIPSQPYQGNKDLCYKSSCYKVYIDQPVERYISLYTLLFPGDKRLVFASAEKKSEVLQELKVTAEKKNIDYKILSVAEAENIPRVFIRGLKHNDVLLALPDSAIYNASNAKSIILASYHANVPIIAYSKSFSKAGALISLYSSIENIADKTVDIINAVRATKKLTRKEFYPDDFKLEINRSVARSLNIAVDSENVIKRKMK